MHPPWKELESLSIQAGTGKCAYVFKSRYDSVNVMENSIPSKRSICG